MVKLAGIRLVRSDSGCETEIWRHLIHRQSSAGVDQLQLGSERLARRIRNRRRRGRPGSEDCAEPLCAELEFRSRREHRDVSRNDSARLRKIAEIKARLNRRRYGWL